jgi:hypothetical protein
LEKKKRKEKKATDLVGIKTWDMQCNLLLRIGRCPVHVSGLRERERERERRSSVSWDVVCNWKANKVLQVHIITHCIVTASNCRLCYGCNVILRTLLLLTVMSLGFYGFCHGLSKWGPCYMTSIRMKLTYYGGRVGLPIWKLTIG